MSTDASESPEDMPLPAIAGELDDAAEADTGAPPSAHLARGLRHRSHDNREHHGDHDGPSAHDNREHHGDHDNHGHPH